ncbi:ABC transporter ATP-binding protein [Lentibacillus sediminis]|uniref:ABC transporter ATP-binding protein n=1 Tax=Lentibacillus sediminis TaxID=1940529 RepID=UPI000C1B8F91|nr:ABC transporter ATP-binding protein [Lentibacillus sediminis]
MLKLFRLLKPYRLQIAAVLVLIFLQSISQLFLPTLMAAIVDTGIVNENISFIIQIGGIMLAVAAIGVVVSIWSGFFTAKISAGFGRNVRERVFAQAENFSLQEFDTFGTSSLITRTTNDIMQVQQVLTLLLRTMIMAPMLFIGAMVLAVWMNPQLSLIIFAPLPIIVIAVVIIAKKGIPLFKALKEKTDRLNLVLREVLTGVRVIRSFNRADYERERFDEANQDYADTAIKVNRIIIHATPIMMLVLNFSVIAIIWFGSYSISNGNLQVGELMAFIQYATQIMFAFIMASVMFVAIPRAAVSAGRINEILETEPKVKEPENAIPLSEVRGQVEFRDVTFSYPGAEKPVLSRISFQANPGEVTAIIGGTGSGKSTLVSLIPRFYDIDEGHILLDGVDIRNITQQELRDQVGFTPQQAYLFAGTINVNIRYGRDSATEEEVREAAKAAQADEFISQLEQGLETPVAQRGANLSGGQRQRLAIARTLLRNPAIYIFDDSFSALDFKTHSRVRDALREKTADATVLLVTQRASTVMDADKIVVLDQGEIAGIGDHSELMQSSEVYREIVASQFTEEDTSS